MISQDCGRGESIEARAEDRNTANIGEGRLPLTNRDFIDGDGQDR
jgi:hypothetical protein